MRPYIFWFLLLIGLAHIGFGLYFFFEALALSSSPKEALDTAIAYTVVNVVLLSVYFGSNWIYSAVTGHANYDALNIEVVRNVYSLYATLLVVPAYVCFWLWINFVRQHSTEDERRGEYYVGPVPTHSAIMFLAAMAQMIILINILSRIWYTLSRSYAPALLAKEIDTYHKERVPV